MIFPMTIRWLGSRGGAVAQPIRTFVLRLTLRLASLRWAASCVSLHATYLWAILAQMCGSDNELDNSHHLLI